MELSGGAIQLFKGAYNGKRVLVTGHTGFKGSWLAIWLSSLGARVAGFSSYLPSSPCNFSVTGLERTIDHRWGDVRELPALKAVFEDFRPEVVFHLAAQPIVRRSYSDPKLTFDTNVGGTVNVLECVRTSGSVKAAVIVTSDKCYENTECVWGYRENDRLGGADPYSASKACAEIAASAYARSFRPQGAPRFATARAGNVVGGGDWAQSRVVPDCVRAWSEGKEAVIRNPASTRPWQHVLEPLSGYLWLGADLLDSDRLHGESFNFGPDQKVDKPVSELIDLFTAYWGGPGWRRGGVLDGKKESSLLKLSCDKALHELGWRPVLSFEDTIRLTAEWYRRYYSGGKEMYAFSEEQIFFYVSEAARAGLPWAREGVPA
ncbi:MAG: CDP-glucose 4,6-dehydratase [Deltaproteobacteria bacterium]|nr:CDP-glucose 4,6-dehydratase [Deltaproteobacteria bacterium]MCL4873340.1 CDP-glucose 4,6-dehydratase [bacterium]